MSFVTPYFSPIHLTLFLEQTSGSPLDYPYHFLLQRSILFGFQLEKPYIFPHIRLFFNPLSAIELWDLEYTDSAFIAETNAWTASSLVNPSIKYYVCGTSWLLGGYSILGNKNFTKKILKLFIRRHGRPIFRKNLHWTPTS